MSRNYEMHINVTEYKEEKEDDIISAVAEHWPVRDNEVSTGSHHGQPIEISMWAHHVLHSGEMEDDFSNKIQRAVLMANGAACCISVTATDMDNVPKEEYEIDKDEAEVMMQELMDEHATGKSYEWTKKLGQQHYALYDVSTTLCGKPMLGNNYAEALAGSDKTPCAECFTEMFKTPTKFAISTHPHGIALNGKQYALDAPEEEDGDVITFGSEDEAREWLDNNCDNPEEIQGDLDSGAISIEEYEEE